MRYTRGRESKGFSGVGPRPASLRSSPRVGSADTLDLPSTLEPAGNYGCGGLSSGWIL